MAITTVDGIISGLQFPRTLSKTIPNTGAGVTTTTWQIAGSPGAGAYDTTLNGVALSAPITGQIPFSNPASGSAYLSRIEAATNGGGTLILADRLWHNGGYTITSASAQNSTTPTWPARDVAGSSDGDGVYLALEISADTGAAAPTITIGYTNSAGTASRTGVNIEATASSGTITNNCYPISLQAGDTGVRSVQSLTLSVSWVSGTINLVAYREIARFSLNPIRRMQMMDAIQGALAKMHNDSVPYIMVVPDAALTNTLGTIGFTHG